MSSNRIALATGGSCGLGRSMSPATLDYGLRRAGRSALALAAVAALLLGLVRVPDGPPSAALASLAYEQRPAAHP
jgi:hypothetical protein